MNSPSNPGSINEFEKICFGILLETGECIDLLSEHCTKKTKDDQPWAEKIFNRFRIFEILSFIDLKHVI